MTNRKIIFGIALVVLIAILITALFLIIRGSQEYTVEITPVFYTNGDKSGTSPKKLTVNLGEKDKINLETTKVSIDANGKVTVSKNGDTTILAYLENYAAHNDSSFDGVIYTEPALKTKEISAKKKSITLSFEPKASDTIEGAKITLEAVFNTNLAYTFEILTEPEYDENGTLLSNGSCIITGFSNEELEDVKLPSSILGIYDVTDINGTAFMHCATIKSLTLPSSVKSIGTLAFAGCRSLSKVTFETNGTATEPSLTIEASAFQDCNALSELTLPSSIKQIKDFAFVGTSLNNITVNIVGERIGEIETVANTAFSGISDISGKSTITKVSAPAFFFSKIAKDSLVSAKITGGTAITAGLFENCTKLKTVEISDTITSVGASAFAGAGVEITTNEDGTENVVSNLLSVTLPSKISSVGENAFFGTKLETLVILNGSVTVAKNAFAEVDTLVNVTAPVSVFEIINRTNLQTIAINGGSAVTSELFKENATLSSVKFIHVIAIEASAFEACPNLKTINLDLAASVGSGAFKNCTALEEASFTNALFIGEFAFANCSGIKRVTLGDDLTSIGEGTFENTGIEEISIPKSVTEIEDSAFNGTPLYKVLVDKESSLVTNAFAELPITDLTAPVATLPCFDKSDVVSLNVNGGTEIPSGIYEGAASLKNLSISNEITTIGDNAFKGCSSLEFASFNGASIIGSYSFKDCEKLTGITLGYGLTTIGEGAFENTGIEEISIPKSVTEIKDGAFNGTPLYKVLVDKESSLVTNAFAELPITDLTAPVATLPCFDKSDVVSLNVNGGTQIPAGIYEGAASLKNLSISNEIIAIGDNAFKGCSALEVASFDGVSAVGSYSFYGCSALNLEVLPTNIKSIGSFAFASSGIGKHTLTIGAAVESIGDGAFQNMSATEITVIAPSAIKNVSFTTLDNEGNVVSVSAFDNTNITKATIPVAFINALTKSSSRETLAEVTIVKSDAVSILDGNFEDCSALTTVTFADGCGIETIGSRAFKNCEKFNTVSFCKSITAIESYAFENTGFVDFVYPETVVEIKDFVFTGCKNLKTFKLHTDITGIEGNAFSYCPILESFYYDEFVENTVSGDKIENNYLPKSMVYTILSASLEEKDFTTADGKVGKIYTTSGSILAKDTTLVVGCIGASNIPNSILSVGDYSYAGRNVPNVVIPYQTQTIGNYAFDACENLTRVEVYDYYAWIYILGGRDEDIFPSNLYSIGDFAFRNCVTLKSINHIAPSGYSPINNLLDKEYPQFRNANHFGIYAFENTAITSFTIPSNVRSIPEGAFKDCVSLASVDLSYAQTVEKYAFMNCRGIRTLTLPSTTTKLGEFSFAGCAFTTLNVENESILAENIHDTAFKGGKLTLDGTEIDVPGVTTVEKMFSPIVVFRKICIENLEVVTVSGEGVIDTALFVTATGLKDVTLLAGISKIETLAFVDKPIKNLRVENVNVTVEDKAFNGVTLAETIYARTRVYDDIKKNGSLSSAVTVTFIGSDDISENLLKDVKTLKKVVISGTIANVYASAFSGCELLESVFLSDSVKTVDSSAFRGCAALRSIDLKNTEKIGASAFEESGLTSVNINSCVTSIGNLAFAKCSSLMSITVSAELSDKITVANDAFNDSKITIATAPAFFFTVNAKPTLTTLTSLTTVTTNNGKVIIDHGFDGYLKINSLTLYKGTETIGNYAFKGLLIESIYLPASVVSLGSYAFEGTPLTTVTVQNQSNLSSIPFDAFDNLLNGGGIKNVTAPVILVAVLTNLRTDMEGKLPSASVATLETVLINGGDSLGEGLFVDCVKLKSVEIYEKISVIEKNSFKNCTSLVSLTLNTSEKISVKADSFISCVSLTTVYIGNSSSLAVEEGSFCDCEKTVTFIFSKNIQNVSIKKESFVNCNGFIVTK